MGEEEIKPKKTFMGTDAVAIQHFSTGKGPTKFQPKTPSDGKAEPKAPPPSALPDLRPHNQLKNAVIRAKPTRSAIHRELCPEHRPALRAALR